MTKSAVISVSRNIDQTFRLSFEAADLKRSFQSIRLSGFRFQDLDNLVKLSIHQTNEMGKLGPKTSSSDNSSSSNATKGSDYCGGFTEQKPCEDSPACWTFEEFSHVAVPMIDGFPMRYDFLINHHAIHGRYTCYKCSEKEFWVTIDFGPKGSEWRHGKYYRIRKTLWTFTEKRNYVDIESMFNENNCLVLIGVFVTMTIIALQEKSNTTCFQMNGI
ncbi:hypothetical protein M3Y95_01033200 [Aphelenchoides besseyi]|nr:hypothetical protein M3Y95_01033200 [Aphelenchoides besseyi]